MGTEEAVDNGPGLGINHADHRNSVDENTVFSVMVTMMLMLMSMMMQSCRQNYIEAGWRGKMMLKTWTNNPGTSGLLSLFRSNGK